MTDFHGCLACLATNIKMYSLKNTQLQEIFEKLANVTYNKGDGRFESVCYICYSQLQKCCRFMDMTQKAGRILTQFLHDGIQDSISPLKAKTINTFVSKILKPTSVGLNLPDDEFVDKNIEDFSYLHLKPNEDKSPRTFANLLVKVEPEENIHEEELMKINDEITIEENFITPKEEEIYNEEHNITEQKDVKKKKVVKKERESIIKNCKIAIKNQIEDRKIDTPADTTKEKDNSLLKVRRKYVRRSKKVNREVKSYACDRCDSKFSCKGYLDRHLRVHTGERPFTCKICFKKFAQSGHLIQHMRLHTGERPYACHICPDKSFNHRSNYKTHMKKHFGERPHACDICQAAFHQKGDLKRHQITHTGERPFACKICTASFTQQGHLSKHVKSHTKETLFRCDFCNLAFAEKLELTNHKKCNHTNENEYKCTFPGCSVSYARQCTLTKHLKLHKTERPHACDKCDKKFKQKAHLTKHCSIFHHNDKKSSNNSNVTLQNQNTQLQNKDDLLKNQHDLPKNQSHLLLTQYNLLQNQNHFLQNRQDLQQLEEEYIIP